MGAVRQVLPRTAAREGSEGSPAEAFKAALGAQAAPGTRRGRLVGKRRGWRAEGRRGPSSRNWRPLRSGALAELTARRP